MRIWRRREPEPADAIRVHSGARFTQLSDPESRGWMAWQPPTDRHSALLSLRTCPHCGGLHPDDFVKLLRDGTTAELADMKYGWPHKLYVTADNPNPDELCAIGATYGGPPDRPLDGGYVALKDMTRQQRRIAKREGYLDKSNGNLPRGILFGTRSQLGGKFYTVHLLDEWVPQRHRDFVAQQTGVRMEPLPDGRFKWSVGRP